MTPPSLITVARQGPGFSRPQRLAVDRFGHLYSLGLHDGHCPGALHLHEIDSSEARRRFPDAFIDRAKDGE
jgi:hypothetical protein